MCCRLQLMILFLNSKILYCFFYYKFKCFPKNQVKQCNIIYVLVWSCIISYIAPISSSLIEQDCCYQCCLYIRFLFYTRIHFFSPSFVLSLSVAHSCKPQRQTAEIAGGEAESFITPNSCAKNPGDQSDFCMLKDIRLYSSGKRRGGGNSLASFHRGNTGWKTCYRNRKLKIYLELLLLNSQVSWNLP